MNINTLFMRWLTLLAGLVTAWQARAQAGKSLIVTRESVPEGSAFVLRRQGKDQGKDQSSGQIIARVGPGSCLPAPIAQTLRDPFIVYELNPDRLVTRRLSVPRQAQAFLAGIVQNQIERLSPWPPAQALYAVDAQPNPEDAGTLNVCVFIAARASIEQINAELAASGLAPSQIVLRPPEVRPQEARGDAARTGDAGKTAPLVLWTRPAAAARNTLQNLPRLIGAGLASAVALSLALSCWALISANALSNDADDVGLRIKSLQRQTQTAHRPQELASLKPEERAWALKDYTPAAVLMLEALSQALPDSAYLTELHLEEATLRLIGLASDAPALIAALEKSGRFSQVHFFAPTTKGQSSGLYKFYIEAHLTERLAASEN